MNVYFCLFLRQQKKIKSLLGKRAQQFPFVSLEQELEAQTRRERCVFLVFEGGFDSCHPHSRFLEIEEPAINNNNVGLWISGKNSGRRTRSYDYVGGVLEGKNGCF